MFAHGWVPVTVLQARRSYRAGDPSPFWLTFEQSIAIEELLERLVRETDLYDSMRQFAYDTLASTGVRPFELVAMQPHHLDPRTRRLTIPVGKGSGAGKPRSFEVSEDFVARWRQHVAGHGLRGSHFMFYAREFRSLGGSRQRQGEWVTVAKHAPMSKRALLQFFTTLRHDLIEAAETGGFPADLLPHWIDGFAPRVMRKTYACQQLIAHRLGLGGLSLEQLQRNLGHDDIGTTRGSYLPDVEAYLDRAAKPRSVRDTAREVAAFMEQAERAG